MSVQEMDDYLAARGRYRRRAVLKGAGILGLAAATATFWRQPSAFASTAAAPQWIGYGNDPAREMYVSWSAGTYNGAIPSVPRPCVRWGTDGHYGAVEPAFASGTVQAIAALNPKFNVVVGDLSYAGGGSGYYANGVPTDVSDFSPGLWDQYLGIVGPAAAQSIPWQVGVGNHEMEPLANNGYIGFTTRFPQAYAPVSATGSTVVKAFTYGNVAVIQLDGNDLSAELSDNNGYTGGLQTTWLERQLASYRAPGGPLFDRYQVDLVVSGHVHAYERSYPVIGSEVTKVVPSAGKVHPGSEGTTYIGAGGGGQGLYTGWYGGVGGGDPANTPGPPLLWEWSGSNTATGGTGTSEDITDPVTNYSAWRRANWSFIVLDVKAPRFFGDETRLRVRAIDPTQNSNGITTTASPAVVDEVTLVRNSRAHHH